MSEGVDVNRKKSEIGKNVNILKESDKKLMYILLTVFVGAIIFLIVMNFVFEGYRNYLIASMSEFGNDVRDAVFINRDNFSNINDFQNESSDSKIVLADDGDVGNDPSGGGGSGGGKTTCTPSCSGKVCGDDGCGGSCGSCSGSEECENYNCVSAGGCGFDIDCSPGEACNTFYSECESISGLSDFVSFDDDTGYVIEYVDWAYLIGVQETDEGGLMKNASTNSYDAAALSSQKISYGFGGYLEFRVNETDKRRKIGFDYGDATVNEAGIKYGLEMRADQTLIVWATVSNDARNWYTAGTYSSGDVFRIAIEQYVDSDYKPQFKVVYYKNNEILMEDTSIVYPPGVRDWYVDTAFYDADSTLDNVIISYPQNSFESFEIYTTPSASIYGDGTLNRPIDFRTLVSDVLNVDDGATITLLDGVYSSPEFWIYISSESEDITIRPNESYKSRINGTLQLYGNRIIVRDLEISGFEESSIRVSDGDFRTVTEFGDGISIVGDEVKVINNYIHDMVQGISSFSNSINPEIYGNIVLNNGVDAADRGHGHGLYIQNIEGVKKVISNVIFSNLGEYNLHGYTQGGQLTNLYLEKNILFRNKALIGSWYGAPVKNLTFISNYLYGSKISFGYTKPDEICDGAEIKNNYLDGVIVNSFQNANIAFNTIFASDSRDNMLYVCYNDPCVFSNNLNSNEYYRADSRLPMHIDGSSWQTFEEWQATTGYDLNSEFNNYMPDNFVVIEPNLYEEGRAHIIVYNWEGLTSVDIDLSVIGFSNGDPYEIRDIQNYEAVLLSGSYNGHVSVPLELTETQAFKGDFNGAYHEIDGGYETPTHTDSRFNVFLVRKV